MENFANEYTEYEKEILVLIQGGGGAGKAGAIWEASKYFLAYVDVETGELKQGEGRIEWPLTDKERQEYGGDWPYNFRDGTIYRLRVRELRDKTVPKGMLPSFFNRFWVVEKLEENVQDERLLDILAKYNKPVIIDDKELGRFELDKALSEFEGDIKWIGDEVSVSLEVDADNKGTWTKALNVLHKLVVDKKQKDKEFRAFAAKELTSLANDWRQQEEGADAAEITEEEFARRIELSELTVTSGGKYIAWLSDDDMFGDHIIAVYGSIKKGPTEACIEG